MALLQESLRDTVVNAPGAGGTVTLKVDIEDDAAANNAILDAKCIRWTCERCKTTHARIWWALTQGSPLMMILVMLKFKKYLLEQILFRLDLPELDTMMVLLVVIPGTAANTTATSGDHEITTFGTSGLVMIEFKKDENYTSRIKDRTMKLFSEAVEDVEYICEAKEDGSKNYKIRGIFMQADIKNRNGRVYPMEVLKKKLLNTTRTLLKRIVHLVNLDIQTDQPLIWNEYPT